MNLMDDGSREESERQWDIFSHILPIILIQI